MHDSIPSFPKESKKKLKLKNGMLPLRSQVVWNYLPLFDILPRPYFKELSSVLIVCQTSDVVSKWFPGNPILNA